MQPMELQVATRLEPLFTAELSYREDVEAIAPAGRREGGLIGTGDGTVRGEPIRGRTRLGMAASHAGAPGRVE
jgi:hypothetical protein